MRPVPFNPDRIRGFDSHATWLEHRHEARRAGRYEIGGSVVPMILGMRPFGKTEFDAWWKLQPDNEEPGRDNDAMARGRRWENRVIEDYAEATGFDVVHERYDALFYDSTPDRLGCPGTIFRRWPTKDPPWDILQVAGDEPWQQATVDGVVWDGEVWGGLEAKTATNHSHWTRESGVVIATWTEECEELLPKNYAAQVYWYLGCTKLPWWDVAVMLPRAGDFPELRHLRVMYDAEHIDTMFQIVGEWRQRHCIDGVPPDLDHSVSARDFLVERYEGPKGNYKPMRTAAEDEAAMLTRYREAKAEAARLDEEIGVLRNQITMRIGDDYGLSFGPGGKHKAIWYRSAGRQSIDIKRLKEEYPDVAADCLRPGTPNRIFRVT